MSKFKNLYVIYYGWLIIFVIIPISLVILFSFVNNEHQISLINYRTFFSKSYLIMTVNSIYYALLISFVSLFFGYLTAYTFSHLRNGYFWILIILLPSWINILLKAYAFIGILGKNGPIDLLLQQFYIVNSELLYTINGFLIVSIYIFLPIIILPLYQAIKRIDYNLIYAAQDLGATNWQILTKIIIPNTKKAIIVALEMVFIPSLSIFMIARLITGNQVITLGTAIEQNFMITNNWPMGCCVATIIIIFLVIFTVIVHRLESDEK